MVREGLRPPLLIFVQSVERAMQLFHALEYDGLRADVLHAERTAAQHEATVSKIRTGQVWVLIATELVARGMDFKGVSLVINYDFPQTTTSYIHRIGRTGRAGRAGQAVTFFTEAADEGEAARPRKRKRTTGREREARGARSQIFEHRKVLRCFAGRT